MAYNSDPKDIYYDEDSGLYIDSETGDVYTDPDGEESAYTID